MTTFWPEDLLPPERRLILRNLDTVHMRAVEWLWRGWIPRGYITIWAGETGAGKSTVLADIAARVTTGRSWPGEPEDVRRPRGRVLWLGSEDGVEEMTVPRLTACGADLSRIAEIEAVKRGNANESFSMQDDLGAVIATLQKAEEETFPFTMLVIDPITSYLPGKRNKRPDMNDAGQLRSIIEPWLKVAGAFKIAIVCVTHFNKDTTRSVIHRVMGTAAFAQTCRSLCAVVSRPDDGPYAKVLLQAKVNLPEHPGGAWRFRTERIEVGKDATTLAAIHATRPVWEALDPGLTTETLAGGERGPTSQYPPLFASWLYEYFGSDTPREGLLTAQVRAAAMEAGVATPRWWDDNSGRYLDKQNIGGTWYCRPKLTA